MRAAASATVLERPRGEGKNRALRVAAAVSGDARAQVVFAGVGAVMVADVERHSVRREVDVAVAVQDGFDDVAPHAGHPVLGRGVPVVEHDAGIERKDEKPLRSSRFEHRPVNGDFQDRSAARGLVQQIRLHQRSVRPVGGSDSGDRCGEIFHDSRRVLGRLGAAARDRRAKHDQR